MAGAVKRYVWKDSQGLTLATIIVVAINAVVIFCSLAVKVIFGATANYDASAGDLSGPQALNVLVDLAGLATLLACIVVLFWIVRASANAHSFRPGMRHSPIGSIGWYIAPVLSLWVPFEAMAEIWDASSPRGTKRGPLLNWWWGLFLVSNVISLVAQVPPLNQLIVLKIAYDFLSLAVSAIFIVMVRRLAAMQILAHQTSVFDDPAEGPAAGSLEALIR